MLLLHGFIPLANKIQPAIEGSRPGPLQGSGVVKAGVPKPPTMTQGRRKMAPGLYPDFFWVGQGGAVVLLPPSLLSPETFLPPHHRLQLLQLPQYHGEVGRECSGWQSDFSPPTYLRSEWQICHLDWRQWAERGLSAHCLSSTEGWLAGSPCH